MVATEAEKIRKQVNFYFSDSNLPYDKFLWTLRANTPEGWIPLETIASFKKMKMITEDFDTIVKALKEVESEIYQVDEEGKNIRRKSEVVQQNHVERSIYVKGLPLVDADAKDPIAELFKLQDKVDDFFSEKGYTVLCVRMKKNDEKPKKFKGSCYIEFSSPEEAKKVAEEATVEFDGNKLEILYKPRYHELKAEQYKDSPIRKHNKSFNAFKPNAQFTSNKRKNQGGFNNNNSKKTKTEEGEETKQEPVAAEAAAEAAPAAEEAKKEE
ncbi:la-motif domain-containing protein [Mucor ambiguus]|uniref:La-motif domain-containing protein n=1 Tax=Mucor ambiguus TaxID=91626 RepID=A0A0C9MNF3_9FUNG|nr:la-motif domain-containing protein [Mucor ambiguus]